MATKCMTITTDVYDQIATLKQPGESFSDVLRRVSSPPSSWEDIRGILSKERAAGLKASIRELNEAAKKELDKKLERMHR